MSVLAADQSTNPTVTIVLAILAAAAGSIGLANAIFGYMQARAQRKSAKSEVVLHVINLPSSNPISPLDNRGWQQQRIKRISVGLGGATILIPWGIDLAKGTAEPWSSAFAALYATTGLVFLTRGLLAGSRAPNRDCVFTVTDSREESFRYSLVALGDMGLRIRHVDRPGGRIQGLTGHRRLPFLKSWNELVTVEISGIDSGGSSITVISESVRLRRRRANQDNIDRFVATILE